MNDQEKTQKIDIDTADKTEIDSTGWYIGIHDQLAGDDEKINDMVTPTDDSHWMPHLKE